MEFSEDIKELSESQINLLKNILVKENFNECKVTLKPLGQKGDNYIATVVSITAEDGKQNTLSMVAKIAPKQEFVRQKLSTAVLFRNETIMYEQLLPKVKELQKSAGVKEIDLFRYPKFYGAISDEPQEMIVLENLKVTGFDMRDRMTSLTDGEVRMVLRNLAAFHAATYALQDKEPELFIKFKNELFDIWATEEDKEKRTAFTQIEEQVIIFFDTEEQRKCLKGILGDLSMNAAALRKTDLDSKYSGIIHGDCWTNNIMFTMEEEKPQECINIDYQLSRAAPPAPELLNFIFGCTDYETSSKYYSNWIDFYHKTLGDFLSYYKLKVSNVYPRGRLEEDLKRYGRVSLGVSILLAMFTVRDSDEAMDLTVDMEESMASGDLIGMSKLKEGSLMRMKKRFQGLWDCYNGNGYL